MSEFSHNTSIDEIFRIVMIDRSRKVKIFIQLRTEDGDEVPIRESVQKMTQWISDKISIEESNQCKEMIYPLMAQCMVGGMDKLMGSDMTCFILAQENIRYSLIHMMTVSFYLLKWIQENNITIHTTEENISDEDIEMYDRINKAGNAAILAQGTSGQGKEVLKNLFLDGHLKESDLKLLGAEDILLEIENSQNDNHNNKNQLN